jgi:hypothetical protein
MTRYSRVINTGYSTSDKSSSPHEDYLEYLAHDDSGNAIAKMAVQHYPEYVTRTQQTDFKTGKPVVDMEMTNTDTPVNSYNLDSTPYTRPAESGEQLAMFGHRNIPAKRVASVLYSKDTLAGKTAAMALMGMANNASTEAIGKNLIPDGNLSLHSGALVDRLHSAGHIPDEDMPSNRYSNSHSFSSSDGVLRNKSTHAYSPNKAENLEDLSSRVPAARTRIRDLLGSSKKGEEHTQLSLWDD